MASSDQDPEIEKRKDKAFERVVAEALSSAAHKDCPDAETLAAFYEHALAPAETGHWRAHFAACARCQQSLAAMAASDPNPLASDEVARLGELVAAAAAPKSRILNWPRFLDPRTLAPLAAAAVLAVALWATLHSPSIAPNEIALQFPAAPPFSEPLTAENAPAPPPPSAPAEPPAATSAPQESSRAAEPRLGTPQPASAPAPPPPAPTAMAQSAARAESSADALEEAQEATPATPAQMPPPEQAQSASGSAAGSGGGVAGGVGSGTGAGAGPAASNGVAGEAAEAPLFTAAPRSARIARQNVIHLRTVAAATPNSQVVWSFGDGGLIARSNDGGQTWTHQYSPAQTDLLAGSAPSESACWLVGRNGAIIRTIDGVHWELVPSPPQAEQNRQPPDWTFVSARDAQSATIGAADGRRFSTTDAGRSWQPQ